MNASTTQPRNIAVIGATGAVGRCILHCLADRHFPIASLRLMASPKSAGMQLDTPLGVHTVEDVDQADFRNIDVALFSAGGAVSKRHAPRAVQAGALVIDNTSAFRMEQEVPLVVPEVNPHDLTPTGIIANPNCSTIQMVLALHALRDLSPLRSVRVATYQSASGAGQKGIDELLLGTRAFLDDQAPTTAKIHARPLCDDGDTEEERKMRQETQKILDLPELPISATCVRVPVIRSHAEVIHVTTLDPISPQQARAAMAKVHGLMPLDSDGPQYYPTARSAEGSYHTFVGRLRRDHAEANALVFWLVSDNLLKGAALNAVQIAELWQQKGSSL